MTSRSVKLTTWPSVHNLAEKTRTTQIVITADKANYPENEIGALVYCGSNHHSKWSFNPPIPKTPKHIVKFSFVTKVERL